MNNRQFEQRMNRLKSLAVEIYKKHTPVDTGYQQSKIHAVDTPDGGFRVVVDTDYATYTMDPRTDGANNPNEDWEEMASAEFLKIAGTILKGNI